MKLLLLLTSVIAVFTADYRGIPGKPGSETDHPTGGYNSFKPVGHDSTDEDQESIEGPVSFTDGPPSLDSSEFEKHYIKERKGQNEMELRGKKPNEVLKELSVNLETFKYIMTHAYSELKVELASIKEHQTNITNIGTALKEEHQNIRDHQYNMTDIFTEFKVELQSIRDHQDNNTAELHPVLEILTDGNSKLKTEVNSLTQNITDSISKLKTEVNSMTLNITDSNSKLKTEVNFMTQNITDSISKLKTEVNSMTQNITDSNSKLEREVNSMTQNITGSNSKLKTEVNSLTHNMTDSNWKLKTEVSSMKLNMNNKFSQLNSKLDSLKAMQATTSIVHTTTPRDIETTVAPSTTSPGCPEGFFKISNSNCFKFYNDSTLSWTAAKSKCQAGGLVLAKTNHPVELRSYLVMKYGGKFAWLAGQGTGSSVEWDRDGTTISNSNTAWWFGSPNGRTATSYCLYLLSDENHMKIKPTKPINMWHCSSSYYALCELVM